MRTNRLAIGLALFFCAGLVVQAQHATGADASDVTRVLPLGKKLDDPRLGKPRTATDKYHPWTPPKTKAEWDKESQAIRERVLVASGLWPMPPKEPLQPVIHG